MGNIFKQRQFRWLLPLLIISLASAGLSAAALKTAVPPAELVDQVVHDKGNIVTTVDNWGYIGGYSYPYDLPSGEWPRNSGHDYIGEMKFWMGTVTPSGDTVVANSVDDFRPLPSLISGESSYQIRLSTDPERYNYDPDDTIGQGLGNPAYGWRVYDHETDQWVYNEIYSPLDSTYYPGGPTGLQQSYCLFEDGNGPTGLGLRVSQTICQWNYCYNEDVVFIILEITNVSGVDYPDFAFAIYSDFDIGGPDGAGENGRLGDLVAFDETENLAWTYDEDGYDPGWGPLVETGLMGTKYLETPDGIGMTAFRTGDWGELPEDDGGRYELIDSEQYDTSLPPTDQYYLQCTRGINLTAGKTIRVVYAIVAGADLQEFYNNAATAQTLYDNHFIGPQPPATPTLTIREGDGRVYLSWDDVAQNDIDLLSGEVDFKGYKLYRSTNRGYTWGKEDRRSANSCLDIDYIPVTAYTLDDIGDPIAHTFIDSNLTNGEEYWYCLVAFDRGDSTVPIGPLQNGFGHPDRDINAVRAVPRSDPAGFFNACSTVEHISTGPEEPSEGQVYPIVFNEFEIMGDEYSVIFTETAETTLWHLIRIDESSGDTVFVLENQLRQEGDPNLYETAEGIRSVVRNGDRIPRTFAQTGFAVEGDTTLHFGYSYGPVADVFMWPSGGDVHFRSTYELRFTASGSEGYSFFDGVTPMSLPFEVWNTSLGYQVYAEIYDQDGDLVWEPEDKDYICIVNYPYDGSPHGEAWPYNYAWFFRLDTVDTEYAVGDIFTVRGAPLNGADDVYTFGTDGVNSSRAASELEGIRVVPDPYIGRASWETSKYERKLQFVNLPDICSVRIFSLSGDLIKTIDHSDGTGTADWNLLTSSGLSIASGIYIYHVESQYGNHVGRFAVIK